MTMYPHSGVLPPQHANTPGLRSASHGVCRALPTLLATALLAACSTTPLPPWPSVRKVPPPKPPQAVVVPAPLGQPLAVPPATAPSPSLPAGQPAALGNVLDNAAKWARQQVTVQVGTQDQRLHLRVVDDGPGFADSQAVLQQRRVRLDEQVPGHGIGLAVVRDLVASHHGTLTVSRAPSGGAQVDVVLQASVF